MTTGMDAGMRGGMGGRERAAIYGFLAVAYHEPPSSAHLPRLRACEEIARRANEKELARGFSELARQIEDCPADLLRQDFDDLLMVPSSKYVTPYESVYRDEPIERRGEAVPRTFGPSTQAVAEFYDRVGLGIAEDYIELPDYVGLEMACMEYLCAKEDEYLRAKRKRKGHNARAHSCYFVREHLGQWIPSLMRRIGEKAGTPYFRTLAILTCAWVERASGTSEA
ncbi:MAG: molecular chaperone TorD family protein [Planctomycetota bacterium]